MGVKALVSHANGNNHLKNVKHKGEIQNFFSKSAIQKVNLKSTRLLTLLNMVIQPLVPQNQLQIRTNLPKNLGLNHL